VGRAPADTVNVDSGRKEAEAYTRCVALGSRGHVLQKVRASAECLGNSRAVVGTAIVAGLTLPRIESLMRRMNALVNDLISAVPEEHREPLRYWDARLKSTIARSFADGEERMEASQQDRQVLGMPRPASTNS
jgi:hypothetical protein